MTKELGRRFDKCVAPKPRSGRILHLLIDGQGSKHANLARIAVELLGFLHDYVERVRSGNAVLIEHPDPIMFLLLCRVRYPSSQSTSCAQVCGHREDGYLWVARREDRAGLVGRSIVNHNNFLELPALSSKCINMPRHCMCGVVSSCYAGHRGMELQEDPFLD